MRRHKLAVLLVLGTAVALILGACSIPTEDTLPTDTPPAATALPTETGGGIDQEVQQYCENVGGVYQLIDEGEGPIGYCVMDETLVCNALDLFNHECYFEVGGGGGQDLPTPTPWAFPTPAWDVQSRWPYGLPEIAIPMEQTFDGPVQVYVLLGSDWMAHRGDEDLTDAILIVMLDTDRNSATVVSVPRDLYVYIPGFGMGRINQAWTLGGIDTVKAAVRYNFGLEVDGVAYARMAAFEKFIDLSLGGVEVYVTQPIIEKCGDLTINLAPGMVYMDGEYALCYARGRSFSSDYSRMSRQQELLLAMKNRFVARAANDPVGLAKELYGAYVDAGIKTDVSLLDLPGLVWSVIEAQDSLHFYRIIPPLVEHFDHPESGAWLLQMPTPEAMHNFLYAALMGLGSEDLDPRD